MVLYLQYNKKEANNNWCNLVVVVVKVSLVTVCDSAEFQSRVNLVDFVFELYMILCVTYKSQYPNPYDLLLSETVWDDT